jgi:hypothetical protein
MGQHEGRVFGGGTHAEFIEVGLPHNNRIGGPEFLYDCAIIRGDEILQYLGSARRPDAFRTKDIFDGQGNTGERPPGSPSNQLVCRLSLSHGPIPAQGEISGNLFFHFLDPLKNRSRQLYSANLPFSQQRLGFMYG